MGITQHRNAVATIKEFVNIALLRATSASPAPDCAPSAATPTSRATARWASGRRPPGHFLDALRDEYGFEPPREHGLDTVDAIRAMRDGKAKVFIGMGGNFVSAAPDTVVTEEAMERADLTVRSPPSSTGRTCAAATPR